MELSPVLGYPLLFLAGAVAGGMNAVAGGGSFITFPALVFTGVPPLIANASNTVAVFPGAFASAWAYRHDFENFKDVPFWIMLVISLIAGSAGALLLIYTPERTFNNLIPWLLLVATAVFAFGPRIAPKLQRIFSIGPVTMMIGQFAIGVYGGYFGAGIGIMMLAVWSLFGLTRINAMNASKTLLGGTINGISVVFFIGADLIWWPETLVTLAGALTGGYWGAAIARKANPVHIRMIIIAISVVMTVVFFARA